MKYEILKTEEGSFTTTFTKKYASAKPWKRLNPKNILSFIPGTITEVMVSEGQQVEKGEILLTFNAMKMSNTFKSPISGRIAKVNVKAGEPVAKGVILIEFE